jgi:integrase
MLTDIKVRNARPRDKAFKIFDSDGLFLFVTPSGSKLWRVKYRFGGKEKLLALGAFGGSPNITLKAARIERDDARALLRKNIDPGKARKAEKLAAAVAATIETFTDVASEYFALHSQKISATTKVRDERILKKLTKSTIGSRALREIETPQILDVLRSIESAGTHETAHRALGLVKRVYEFALACGRADRDASSGLGKALAPVVSKRRAAVTSPRQLGALLRCVDGYSGQPTTTAAIKLLAMLFVRPGELRLARWGEVDLDGALWVVPAQRTKMRREHLVPLPSQALDILRELAKLTDRGADSFLLPSLRPQRPLSENTINLALRTMGFDGQTHVGHGFRSSASTLLHQLGHDPMVIETQLAHARPGVAGVYNRSHLLPQRRELLEAWCSYLDAIKTDEANKVRALRA